MDVCIVFGKLGVVKMSVFHRMVYWNCSVSNKLLASCFMELNKWFKSFMEMQTFWSQHSYRTR